MAHRTTVPVTPPTARDRLAAFRRGLGPADRRSLIGMAVFIVMLHAVGFAVLLGLVNPHAYGLGGNHQVFSAGVGILAYTFGLRHAFDADHIAAIDNTARKLIADNVVPTAEGVPLRPKPLSVGFWFSLGHSTVVFVLAFVLSIGFKALVGPVADHSSRLHTITSVIGPLVSGMFLWLLGILNLAAVFGILKVFRAMRHGPYDECALERHLDSRGFMNRFLGSLTRTITEPWHIYPIGVLFGLGFDTASEVGLLVLAGGAAAYGLPFYAVLVLPILFAAGMCLMDTIDGVFMNVAYGWAFGLPIRKVFYNLTITTISVIVALLIGTIELLSALADRLSIDHGPLAWFAGINLDYAGYAIAGLFAACWLVAICVWRFARVEERWAGSLAE